MYRLCTKKCTSLPNMKLAFGGRHQQKNSIISVNNTSAACWWYPGAKRSHTLDPHTRAPGSPQKVKLCSNALSKRQQSTTTTNAEQQPVKEDKKVPNYKLPKYVEILEVTDTTSFESMTRVQRLNAKKLQSFIKAKKQMFQKKQDEKMPNVKVYTSKLQPVEYQRIDMEALDNSIIASGLYDDRPMIFCGKNINSVHIIESPDEIENILKSFQNFRDLIEGIQHEKDEPVEAYSLLPGNCAEADVQIGTLDTSKPFSAADVIVLDTKKSANQPKAAVSSKPKTRYKSKVHTSEEQERLAKERGIRINLAAYLNVSISADLLHRSYNVLMAYRQRAIDSPEQSNNLVTIELYNILLHGFAQKGVFDRFNNILKLIKEDGNEFNEQTFAAIFELYGRLEGTEENDKKIKHYIENANDLGFTLNQIMDKSKFVRDQREIVLQTIRRIQPDFIPIYTPPELGYYNTLLNHLNKNVRGFDETKQKKSSQNKKLPGSEIMHAKYGYTKDDLLIKAQEQLQLETSGIITIKSIEKSKIYPNSEFCRSKLKEIEVLWRQQINDAILREMNTIKAQMHYKPNGFMNYFTYLRAIDSAHYVEILINEIFKIASGSESFSATVCQLYRDLGLQAYRRYQLDQAQKKGKQAKLCEIYAEYCHIWDENSGCPTSDNSRQMWQRIVHEQRKSGPSMDINEAAWPSNVLYGVGRFLYNILLRDVKIDSQIMRENTKSKSLVPAFYSLYRNSGRMVKEEVKPHPLLARLIRASRQQTLTFESNLVPMLCPPQPWTTPHTGGYLLNKSDLIRLPFQAVQQWERINSLNPQFMYPALDSLNQLSSIPWRVNTDILDIIIEVFQNGGDSKLDVPEPPQSLPPLPSIEKYDTSISNADRAKLFKDKLGYRRKQAEMYSMWCDALYRLSLANHYRDKVFWLPHNMDFRGRVYPIPPHLNHLGSDLARSMLVFDKPQPLGPDGFSWLKLHCINLTGLKKRNSVHERLLYAEDVIEEILDSADRPLTGRKWWATSDEPWQTLACCQEIAKVQRSSDREGYLSRFPIHQDGSCNGLQHYAALGRDKAGGFSVNLSSSTVPQDVYSAVATLVEKSRKEDAENGIHVAQALDGFVRRKVIKQTVMTTVYGVTRFGARLQIARQLKDINNFPKEWVWPASTYLTTKTFESLREMFTSTKEIQDWFTDCARLISSVGDKNVEWVTPLGFPIVQPYNRIEMKNVERTGSRIPEASSTDMYERPNVLKQKNAFPPNFIHSLDSCHMMLTSLHCERKGMTFVSVHDCFWTHACSVPDMNKICREQFVALHSQPILEDLSKLLKDRFSFKKTDFSHDGSSQDLAKYNLNRSLGLLPQRGDLDLRSVLDSTYFFS